MNNTYSKEDINKFLVFVKSYIKDYELNYQPYLKDKLNDKEKLMKEHYAVYKSLIPYIESYLEIDKTYDFNMSVDSLQKHFRQRLKNNKINAIKHTSPQAKAITKKEHEVVNTALYVLRNVKND